MRRVLDLRGEILPRPVQILVQTASPLWAVSDVIHNALEGDVHWATSLTCVQAELSQAEYRITFWTLVMHGRDSTFAALSREMYTGCCMIHLSAIINDINGAAR
jgi:hypothetical protein